MKLDLRKSLFILPNLFTFSSVFCGFYAVLILMGETNDETFYRAALLIVYAMFFDAIDGRVARLTRTQSAFGVQVDSLADVMSFGMVPAVLVYRWSLHEMGAVGIAACFAYVVAGTARLARFNVLSMAESGAPKKPGKYIVGLPIPGAAGILVSIVVANHTIQGVIPWSSGVISAVMIALAFFMVSTIKFRSFKDLRLNWRTVSFVVIALGSSFAIAMMLHISYALVWLLTSYIAIGVFESLFRLSRRGLGRGNTDDEELYDDDEQYDTEPFDSAPFDGLDDEDDELIEDEAL